MTVCRSSLFAEALFSPCTIFYAFGGKIPFSKILLIKKAICPKLDTVSSALGV